MDATITDADGVSTARTLNAFAELVREKVGTLPAMTYDHDALGRVVQVSEVPGSGTARITQMTYNGSAVATVRDPLGNVTTYTTDGVGRVTRTVAPGGATTDLTGDAEGRQTSITPPGK